jgi:hypothetical protein
MMRSDVEDAVPMVGHGGAENVVGAGRRCTFGRFVAAFIAVVVFLGLVLVVVKLALKK